MACALWDCLDDTVMIDWREANEGPRWVPVLHVAEHDYEIPHDLLARVAYQESHFREDIIRGLTKSKAGARGIMQMMPRYFDTVTASIPFSDTAVGEQINQAAAELHRLHRITNDWRMAVAAYNCGLKRVQSAKGIPHIAETVKYIADISHDLPEVFV
jgi:membrane-bound lytic murein transglycosylase MltF